MKYLPTLYQFYEHLGKEFSNKNNDDSNNNMSLFNDHI